MSALGHEQTSWLVALDVSFGPEADAVLCSSIVPRTSARLLHPTPALNEPVADPYDVTLTSLRAVPLLLRHTTTESTVRYLGIEVNDALVIAQVDV